MADESIGNLVVEITGDYSELQGQLDAAASSAEASANTIAEAFDKPSVGSEMAASIEAVGTASTQTAGDVATLGEDSQSAVAPMEALGSAAQGAATPIEEVATSTEHASSAAHEGHDAFGELGEKLLELGAVLGIATGLEELAHEAVTAFATVESVTVGLTQLTGSAEQADEAIAKIKEMAASEPFSFPEIAPTAQRLVALGVALEDLPRVLQAAADAASATGNSFDAVAGALGRIEVTGQVSARQLVNLGISWKDLATTMGVTIEQAQELMKKNGQTAEEDMAAVLATINDKFAGATQAQAETVSGQWKIFKNDWEELMVGIGEAVEPAVKAIIEGFSGAIDRARELGNAVKDLKDDFGFLSDIHIGDVITGLLRPFGDAVTLISAGLELLAGHTDKARLLMERLHDDEGQLYVQSTKLGPALTSVGDAAGHAGDASGKAAGQHDVHATALANLSKATGDYTNSLASLTQKQKDADQEFEYALDVYKKASQGAQDGSVSADVLARAVKELDTEAKAAGLSMQEVADRLPTVGDDFVKCATDADRLDDSVGGLAQSLGDGFIVMDKAGQQTVEFIGQTEDATGASDNYAISIENGVEVLRGLHEGLQTANDDLEANAIALADAANAAWDLAAADQAISTDAAQAADEEDNLANATTRASSAGGKGGGKGGGMSTGSLFEDLASISIGSSNFGIGGSPTGNDLIAAAAAAGYVSLGGGANDFVTLQEWNDMMAASGYHASSVNPNGSLNFDKTPTSASSSAHASSTPNSSTNASAQVSASGTADINSSLSQLGSSSTTAASGTTALTTATTAAASTITQASQQIAQASTAVSLVGSTAAVVAQAIVQAVSPGILGSNSRIEMPGAPAVPVSPIALGSNAPVGPTAYSTSGVGTGLQLTVNVTGNTVNGTQGMNDLSNRVADSIVTRLRTVAGLKL